MPSMYVLHCAVDTAMTEATDAEKLGIALSCVQGSATDGTSPPHSPDSPATSPRETLRFLSTKRSVREFWSRREFSGGRAWQ
ncbi:Protein of unknown function [Pyronema omphalodes CBS 100304]|uniref:Uncharacterized protein n=1 Tax=Pyronema omphalodes (strain CBS 100304) TaxID=1076935 RepID=U4KX99_PYROM|nr:Protein of unknown function [Pyronema omphalodes CBS 100304]